MKRVTLRDRTLRVLGEELGGRLLERGAVHPIRGLNRKAPGYRGHNEPWFDLETTDFVALGFNAGPQSGLTVWDLDRRDLELPGTPNLLTRKGSHTYTPYVGERHLQRGVPGLDVLSNGNVAFWADTGEKQMMSTALGNSSDLHDFWRTHAGWPIHLQDERIGTSSQGREGTSTYAARGVDLPWLGYSRQVASRGFYLDVPSIEVACVMRMDRAPNGTRNGTLFQQCLVLIECGSDPWILAGPALRAGLYESEIAGVIAKATVAFNPSRKATVLNRADAWREACRLLVDPRWHPLLDELVQRAIEQNTISPMINQSGLRIGVGQPTISRRLSEFDRSGIVHKRPLGRRGLMMRSNCYWLCTHLSSKFRDQPCVCVADRLSREGR